MSEFKGIVFWTSNICMHSASIFEYIASKTPVIIACKSEEYGAFGTMKIVNAHIIHINATKDVDDILIKTKDHIHINSFLKTYPGVEVFGYALRKLLNAKYTVMAVNIEQYQYWGWKGLLRRVQWFYLYNISIGRKIKALGGTGISGMTALKKALVPERKLFDLIYSVPEPNSYILPPPKSISIFHQSNEIKFIYIGQIVERKCVLQMIDVFNSIEKNYSLEIIGAGNLEKQLLSKIKGNNRIHYHGRLMPAQVRGILSQTDVLLQTSKLEGWGCTVNEALMFGNRVIVSDAVGARDLISNRSFLGQTFKSGDWNELRTCIENEINNGSLTIDKRKRISDWAKNIYPEAVGDYLLNIINYYMDKSNKNKPVAPWN